MQFNVTITIIYLDNNLVLINKHTTVKLKKVSTTFKLSTLYTTY
jgi:hypothetical protein